VERDALFNTLLLRDSGRVALPLVGAGKRRTWEARSYWETHGESVTLRVFTGMQGWLADLVPTAGGRTLAGSARYLSDAVVVGAEALRVAVTLTRIDCDPAWPTIATTDRALRPWQRGQAFLEQQVDRPAMIADGVALPSGLVAVRALRHNENGRLDANDLRPGVARVVLQFVVESDGRADASSVKVLASDGDVFTARAKEALRTMRFRPGLRGGVAVHQLTAQRFEVRR